jgi:hypothetical protein
MRVLYLAAVLQQVSAQFGLCLYNLTIPEGGTFACDPPAALPQICGFQCQPGYFRPATSGLELTCMNSICTNKCTVEQRTCKGAVPVQREGPYGPYTDYVQEERPCCALQVPDELGCNVGPCTGSCGDPGVYTFEAQSCPDVCVPFREVPNPRFECNPCVLPPLTAPAVFTTIEGLPPAKATAGCPRGFWGAPMETICTTTGQWYPPPLVTCTVCSSHPYKLGDLDGTMLEIEEGEGVVVIRCKPAYKPAEWWFECDSKSGAWTEWTDVGCQEWPSILPSHSAAPTQSTEPSTSPSKTPRPPKIKGSRAPSPVAKMFGSRPPDTRP